MTDLDNVAMIVAASEVEAELHSIPIHRWASGDRAMTVHYLDQIRTLLARNYKEEAMTALGFARYHLEWTQKYAEEEYKGVQR